MVDRPNIRIKTNKAGTRIAQRWSPIELRWLPMPIVTADHMLAEAAKLVVFERPAQKEEPKP